MDKIRIEINMGTAERPDWQELRLGNGTKITMHRVNRIFDRGSSGAFSQKIDIDVEANKHIVGNMGEVHGESVFGLNGRKFRYFIGGVPMMSGVVKMSKDVDVDDNISIELASANKEWDELLEGKGLRDLELWTTNEDGEKVEVFIGGCLSDNIQAVCYVRQDIFHHVTTKSTSADDRRTLRLYESHECVSKNDDGNGWERVALSGIAPPKHLALWKETINVTEEYNPITRLPPYCNIRTCFQEYNKGKDGLTKVRGYSVKEANDYNSAPCFYVLYVLDLVLDALNIKKSRSALDNIQDIRRLAFIHTNIGYKYHEEGWYHKHLDGLKFPADGSHMSAELKSKVKNQYEYEMCDRKQYEEDEDHAPSTYYTGTVVKTKHGGREDWSITEIDTIRGASFFNPKTYYAYATSDNLPDIGFSDFIKGLEDGFGCRFLYNPETGTVEVVSLQEVLTQSDVTDIHGIVKGGYKIEKDIRGFVLRYQSAEERKKNSITGEVELTKGDEDTTYNYYDYRRVVLYGSQRTDAEAPNNYASLLLAVNDHNENLYVNTDNGDEQRVKVDKDAKVVDEWFPSLFEVNGYRDVRIGDCSDMDYVEEIAIGFSPALTNDVNAKEIFKSASGVSDEEAHPMYATFMDGEIFVQDMENYKTVRQPYSYDNLSLGGQMINTKGNAVPRATIDCTLEIKSKYDYDRNGTDPFFDGKADFVLGIMRGGGSEASRIEIDEDFDGEGNSRWLNLAGSDSEMYSDSCNSMGEFFDYNGDEMPGLGYDGKALSLKLKAEKPIGGGADGFTQDCYYPIGADYAKRGIFDRFYWMYAYLMLNGKWVKRTMEMSIAELKEVDMLKKVKVGDVVGFITEYTWSYSEEKGVCDVEFTLVYL